MALRIALLAAIAAALAVPTAATAGGWATVGFDPPPEPLAPGEPWDVEMTILQHGISPLEGLKPRVIVTPAAGGEQETFPARATGEPGVYRATVVFASAGTWRYVVDDGFAARHSYPAVQVGKGGKRAATEPVAAINAAAAAPPSAGDDGPNVLLALGAAAVAALAAGLGAAYLQRRRGGTSPAEG
ncbi:MAG TPA: FixH family protein [Thermoleophilaceae bacterium]|nr:FixH family protein [Thermoleophilaceae bacterium]